MKRFNELFAQKQYHEYLLEMSNYLKSGFGVDEELIYMYITSLIQVKKYGQAISFLDNLVRGKRDRTFSLKLADLYLKCYKPNIVEKLIMESNNITIDERYLLIKALMMQGKLDSACYELFAVLNLPNLQESDYIKFDYLLKLIENHNKFGAYIETDYNSFIGAGNTLKKGNIVRIKKDIEVPSNVETTYVVWKIQNDILFLIPIDENPEDSIYTLLSKDYPNINKNRCVKNSLCTYSKDDILSVVDKLNETDFERINVRITNSRYLKKSMSQVSDSSNSKVVCQKDIIEYNEANVKRTYFVLSASRGEYFKVVELTNDTSSLISTKCEFQKKTKRIDNAYTPSVQECERILAMIPDTILKDSLKGARISYFGQKMIVVGENSDKLICIGIPYSASYLHFYRVPLKEEFNIDGYLSSEELDVLGRALVEYKISNPRYYGTYMGKKATKK